jgi:hypothetical protein
LADLDVDEKIRIKYILRINIVKIRVQWQASVNKVIKLRYSIKGGEFLD